MKIKAHALITNPVDFINSEHKASYVEVYSTDMSEYFTGSVSLGEIEINLGDIDQETLYKSALEHIDQAEKKTREEFEAKLLTLKETRQNLLAITYEGDV